MGLSLLLNGQIHVSPTLPENPTLEHLIIDLGLQADRVAIERNGDIVPRRLWSETTLTEGDRLEVVHFVGGGA